MAVNEHTHPTSPLQRLLGLLAVVALLATACGAEVFDVAGNAQETSSESADFATDEGDFDTGAMDDDAMEEEAMAESEVETSGADAPAEGAAEPGTNSSGQTPPTRTAAQRGREIIYTATIAVGVDDVAAAGAEASQIIEEIGGFVANQNTTGGAEPRSQITFKVDPENFSVILERLAGIGELRNQSVSTDDVTERVVDLSSRIEVTQLGVDRLREAMENATDLEDFARLEQLLLARESDLEVMRGTLRTLRDQIDLATITLILEQDRVSNGIELAFNIYEGHDSGAACPGTDGRRFEPGDEITLCLEAINVGDQTLTNLNITDTVLEIDGLDDLVTVFGDPNDIQPGQSVMFAYELEVERDINMRLSMTASPTDGTNATDGGPAVRTQASPSIRVDEDAADPGFGDGFGAGAALLSAIWTAVKVIAGFIIPLLVLLPVFALIIFGLRRLNASRRERKTAKRMAHQPPPPRAGGEAATAAVAGATAAAAPQETGSDESE